MIKLGHFDRGYSPSSLQRKYSLTYEQGVALACEIQTLKDQLAEANEVIKFYDNKDFHYQTEDGVVMGSEPAHKYKIKWGVK